MRKLNQSLIVAFLFLILTLSFLVGQEYSGGSTQNVVQQAAMQVSPPATVYTIKSDLDTGIIGLTKLYDPNGNLVADALAPGKGKFIVTENRDKVTIKNNLAENGRIGFGTTGKRAEISNMDGFSEATFIPKENTIILNERSTADVYIGGTELKQITDAKITMSENGNIDYASFVSKKGERYVFYYEGKDYTIGANAGDRVVFDPKSNKITGSSLSGKDMSFGLDEEKLDKFGYLMPERQSSVKAKDFEIFLDENGKVKEVNLMNGGTYNDWQNKLDYSSKDKFSIFYDGGDVKNYEGNAVSISKSEEEGLSIKAKGLVNVNDLDKKIVYSGKTAGVYSEYDYDASYFDVQSGEASVSNGKHKVDIKDGLAVNDDNLEYSGKEASPFSVSYSKDGKEKDSLLVNYLEKDGKIQAEAIHFRDGEENIVDLGNLAEQEVRYAERTRLPTKADIDSAIFELDTNDPQYEKKVADLYATRGLMSEQEISSYKVGQEVFEVSEGHMRVLGKIAKINEDGTFVLEGGYYYNVQDIGAVSRNSMTISKNQLDKLQVSKLGLGQEVGDTTIKDIVYDSTTKQIKYVFENGQTNLEKQTILDYFSEDYKTAISYYQEAQKNPQLAKEASLGLASVYQQRGDTGSARDQYINLLRDENLDEQTKSLAYKGLISNYFQEQNPRMALSTTFKASQENPNDATLAELNKQLTKSYLETINSAINTEDADVLTKWKEKVGFDEKWYDVGLDQPIVSWFKEDINFATGFSRDQLSEQQKGILVMENLLDRGYSLKDVQNMNANQIRDIFQIQSAEAVSMTNAIKTAFQNSDVQNLANGARQSFQFETGAGYTDANFFQYMFKGDEAFQKAGGYVDKSYLERGIAERILSDSDVKTTAETTLLIGVPIAIGTKLATNAILASSIGKTVWGRALTMPLTISNIKQLAGSIETQSLIKGLASESGASLGTANLANTKITSLEFDDVASVNGFLNKNVLGSTDKGIRILSKDAKAGQYLLEMNGQQFLTRIAGQEMSGALQSQLLLAPTGETLLLSEGSYASGRLLLNPLREPKGLLPIRTDSFLMTHGETWTIIDSKTLANQLDSEFATSAVTELEGRSYRQTLQEMENLGYKFGESNFVDIGEAKEGSISHGFQVVKVSSSSSEAIKLLALRHEMDHFVTFKNWANEQGITLTRENIRKTASDYYFDSQKPSLFYFNHNTAQYVSSTMAQKGDIPVLANRKLIDEANSWIRDDLMRAHNSKAMVVKFGPEASLESVISWIKTFKSSHPNENPYVVYWNENSMGALAKAYKMSPDTTLFKLNPSESDLRLLEKVTERCKSCTAPLDIEGIKFCPYCGTEISKFVQGNVNF